MKKKILISVMAALCLFFSVLAQHVNGLKPLKVGDRLPYVQFNNVINTTADTLSTASFAGKVVILDFWATWCAPCVASFPRMQALQKKFGDKLLILQVAYQSPKIIRDFYEASAKAGTPRAKLVGLVGDTVLVRLFPHTSLPHYVWLNQKGVVTATTDDAEVTETNIAKLLAQLPAQMKEKKDDPLQDYDNRKPMFINNNGQVGNRLVYHSLLSGYVPGIRSGMTRYPLDSVSGLKITLRNAPLIWLFRTAYEADKEMFMPNRIVLAVKDSAALTSQAIGQDYENWLKDGNGYCYELLVPPVLAKQAYRMMQKDIAIFFPEYDIQIKKRVQDCWVLTRSKKGARLQTAGGVPEATFSSNGFTLRNASINNLIAQLNGIYMQLSPYPAIDETGLKEHVDLEVAADLSDINSINRGLQKYGLALVKGSRSIDALYITDHPQ